jgi:hypothetical protein
MRPWALTPAAVICSADMPIHSGVFSIGGKLKQSGVPLQGHSDAGVALFFLRLPTESLPKINYPWVYPSASRFAYPYSHTQSSSLFLLLSTTIGSSLSAC